MNAIGGNTAPAKTRVDIQKIMEARYCIDDTAIFVIIAVTAEN